MSNHYFKESTKPVRKYLISDFIRGVSVEFLVAEGIFSYRKVDKGTKLLIEKAVINDGDIVLDLGCGYGAIGITLAKAIPSIKVYMVDINKLAVNLARKNAELNGVADRVYVLHGDLYEPVESMKFNVIVSNPPIAVGFKLLKKLIDEAPQHLIKNGSLQIVVRKGEKIAKDFMNNAFGNVKVLTRKSGYTILMSIKN